MKSPIKWMGGKSRSVKKIVPNIPVHKTYVEPFFGAGWVFFGKEPSNMEIINDVNSQLINFFEVLKCNSEELIERINLTFRSRELFLKYRDSLDCENLSPLEKAFRFYYINQNAFGGLIRYNSKGKCNSPFAGSPDSFSLSSYWDYEKLKKAHERLKDVVVENDTYQKIIKRYDREYTFFYLDPPYESKGRYNGDNFFDYDELKQLCLDIKGKFILTLNSELYGKFSVFNVYENNVPYTINCNKKENKSSKKELIISNFDFNISKTDESHEIV